MLGLKANIPEPAVGVVCIFSLPLGSKKQELRSVFPRGEDQLTAQYNNLENTQNSNTL